MLQLPDTAHARAAFALKRHFAHDAVAFASAYGAAALGVAVSASTGDALYGCVVAWALAAVASDGGKRTTETLGEVPLRALAKAARWSSRIVLVFGVARAMAMQA